MKSTIEFLRRKEWSMGNGQCPECCGVSQEWLGHPLYLTDERIGHYEYCGLAKSLRELGQDVVFIGEFHSDKEYETYITESGFLATRLKTAEGCPILNRKRQEWEDKLFEILTRND